MHAGTLLRLCAALLALAAGVASAAGATPGVSFTHKDWSVDCDNTGTCRASGYQRDNDTETVTVLLTRAAGPGAAISAQLQLGAFSDDAPKPVGTLRMTVAGHAAGKVDDGTEMTPAQVSALLKALTGTGEVVFSDGKTRWRLSGDGAAAVLLKMDDAQGRIGTPGALVKKGTKPEASVPGPVKPPVIQAVRVPAPVEADVPLALKVLASVPKNDDCDMLADLQAAKDPDTSDVNLWRLGGGRVLVSAMCWRAAYNTGSGYWIARDKSPYDAKLVTAVASDFAPDSGTITSSQKGRGVGDCWGIEDWVWDGHDFVHADQSTTGQCRFIVAGGAWQLPTLVSEVRKPR